MRKKTFVLVAAAVAVLLTGCGKKQQSLPTSDAYPVMTIGQQNASLSTTYPATIRGIQDVDIRPKVSGFITSVRVHEGQAVAKGQSLLYHRRRDIPSGSASGRGCRKRGKGSGNANPPR